MAKRIMVGFSEIEKSMIREIMAKRGQTFQWVMHFALSELYQNEIGNKPAYVKAKEKALEIQEKRVNAFEKLGVLPMAKALRLEDKGKIICDTVGGKITDDGYCKYTVYESCQNSNRISDEKVPLENMSESNVELQYRPDKKGYLKFCKDNGLDATAL